MRISAATPGVLPLLPYLHLEWSDTHFYLKLPSQDFTIAMTPAYVDVLHTLMGEWLATHPVAVTPEDPEAIDRV